LEKRRELIEKRGKLGEKKGKGRGSRAKCPSSPPPPDPEQRRGKGCGGVQRRIDGAGGEEWCRLWAVVQRKLGEESGMAVAW
jgi:hypothetical protein